jgi:hypothetical protein
VAVGAWRAGGPFLLALNRTMFLPCRRMKPEDFLSPQDRLKLQQIRRNIERLERESV